jgi:hypothetical protein
MTPDPALPVAAAQHDAQRLKPFRLRFQKFNVLFAHRQSALSSATGRSIELRNTL